MHVVLFSSQSSSATPIMTESRWASCLYCIAMTRARNTLRSSRWNSTRTAVLTRQCDHFEGLHVAYNVLQRIVVDTRDLQSSVGELISSHWVVILLIHHLAFLVRELPSFCFRFPMPIHLSNQLSKQLVSKRKSHPRPKRDVVVVRAPAQV